MHNYSENSCELEYRKMTFKIYADRKVIDDLSIEVSDLTSAQNIINVLAAQGATDITYRYEEVIIATEEPTNESNETETNETEDSNTNY